MSCHVCNFAAEFLMMLSTHYQKESEKKVLLASLSKPDVEGMKALLRVAGSLLRLGKAKYAKSHAIDLGISIDI